MKTFNFYLTNIFPPSTSEKLRSWIEFATCGFRHFENFVTFEITTECGCFDGWPPEGEGKARGRERANAFHEEEEGDISEWGK